MIVLTESSYPVQFNISSLDGLIYSGTATNGSHTNVTLASTLQVRNTTHAYRQLGLRVSSPSDQPISVVLVGYTSSPRSTYLGLPCHEQPTQDYVYYGMSHISSRTGFYSQILLVGCRDNTTVTITPSKNVQLPQDPQLSNSSMISITAGSSHTFTLHSLQTLLITAEMVDLSGTKVVSNHPLTVVGGHNCAEVPQSFDGCDPISTQIPPTINWGTHFLLTPLQSRVNGQRYRLISSENDTNIIVKCSNIFVNNSLALSGTVYSFDTNGTQFCSCVCSKPCYVSELAFGGDYPFRQSGYGDPLLMTVPPIVQYPHSVTFTALPDTPFNFYSIAVPADSYYNGNVIINGTLTAPTWTPIRSANGTVVGYGYSQVAYNVSTISHSHPNGRVYVSAYGFDLAAGYGYLTGTELKPLLFVKFNSSTYFTNEQASEVMLYISRSNRLSSTVTLSVVTLISSISPAIGRYTLINYSNITTVFFL